jgi:hypothetical protein
MFKKYRMANITQNGRTEMFFFEGSPASFVLRQKGRLLINRCWRISKKDYLAAIKLVEED